MNPADNLKEIHGIGPSIESRLHGAGILTFAQLAELSPEDLEAQVGLTEKRHALAEWIEEARGRASGRALPPRGRGASRPIATFRVELEFDPTDGIVATRAVDLDGGEEASWHALPADELAAFLRSQAVGPPREPSPPSGATAHGHPSAEAPGPGRAEVAGQVRLDRLEPWVAGAPGARTIPAGAPFTLRADVDLSGLRAPPRLSLPFALTVCAEGLLGGDRRTIAHEEGRLSADERALTLELGAAGLPRDVYRLLAFLVVRPARGSASTAAALAATSETAPVQVI